MSEELSVSVAYFQGTGRGMIQVPFPKLHLIIDFDILIVEFSVKDRLDNGI